MIMPQVPASLRLRIEPRNTFWTCIMTRFSFLKRLANTGSLIFVICLPISASTLTGCSGATTTAGSDRACCRGLVLECAACEEGLTIDQWLSKTCPNGENNAFYGGWDASKNKDIWICENV